MGVEYPISHPTVIPDNVRTKYNTKYNTNLMQIALSDIIDKKSSKI